MIADVCELRKTDKKGKGLFATQFIPKGTIIGFRCSKCKVVCSGKEFAKLSQKERAKLLEHAYIDEQGDAVQSCGLYNFINHSCDANILDVGEEYVFDIVVRDIHKGEELTYDYRAFYDPNEGEFTCKCNAPSCDGTLRFDHPSSRLQECIWHSQIANAMDEIKSVPQPLKEQLLKEHPKYGTLFAD